MLLTDFSLHIYFNKSVKSQQFQSEALGIRIKWPLNQQICLAPIISVLLLCTRRDSCHKQSAGKFCIIFPMNIADYCTDDCIPSLWDSSISNHYFALQEFAITFPASFSVLCCFVSPLYWKLKHPAVSISIDLVVLIYLPLRVLLLSRSGIGKFMNVVLLIWVLYSVSCLADFVLLVKNFFYVSFSKCEIWKEQDSWKWVLYNYRICFAKFKLNSELSQSSSYLFVAFIPFFRGVIYQWESWEGRHVRGRVRKHVHYEWYFLHLALKILGFKVKNCKQNKNIISNSVLLSHWPACFDKHGCMFTYITWTHSWRDNLHKIFCSLSTAC